MGRKPRAQDVRGVLLDDIRPLLLLVEMNYAAAHFLGCQTVRRDVVELERSALGCGDFGLLVHSDLFFAK